MKNKWIQKLDPLIYYSRNSIGLRGDEPPANLKDYISIITIGGSTTECKFLSDSCTWPYLLKEQLKVYHPNIWLNNAGMDGHSTFGHLVLLEDYIVKIKPKYALFLIGVNDVQSDQPSNFDETEMQKVNFHSIKSFFKSIMSYSEVLALGVSLYRFNIAYKKGLIHKEVDFSHLPQSNISETDTKKTIDRQSRYLSNYQKRIEKIIKICDSAFITPVFLTQPSLYGDYMDSTTHVAMANCKISEEDYNARTMGIVLEKYNDVVRDLCKEKNIAMVDLSAKMPKDSKYYYDFIHYTNEGAKKVASIISSQLKDILK